MDLRARWQRARSRLNLPVVGRIAQSALAAGAAWEIALQIPGHGKPFFAPIAAVIALGAERGRRGRQAIEVMVGVTIGILLGAAIVAVAGVGGWQLVLATAVALVAATAAAAPPVVRTQAAASAILVVALHQPGTNLALQRLIDALIGGGIAIVLARLLFPVDPLDLVRDEARQLRARVADALEEVAAALTTGDRGQARSALRRLNALDERRLDDALSLARDVARRAPRRRPLRKRLEALGESWLELEASVNDARAVATGALRLLGEGAAPAPELVEAVRAAAAAVRTVDPEEARTTAESARIAAARAREQDASLGASVVTVGVISVAEHALRAAAAREAASVS
ncbi:MAG: FUSC family protein [Actinomycetota bacterium]|nr:FUSC family protein [Actinomycetota bacterium]